MCPVTLAALLGLAASPCAIEQRAAILAPADPRLETHWKPDPLFGGMKNYRPVGPKTWGASRPKAPAAQQTMPQMDHGTDHQTGHHHERVPQMPAPAEPSMPMNHHHMMNMDHKNMDGMQ